MTPSTTLRNIGLYVALALGGATLATGLQLGQDLAGTAPIEIRPLAATFVTTLFGTLSTVLGAMFLPRTGSEGLATLVNAVGRPAATAALTEEAAKQDSLSPEDIALLNAEADRIRRIKPLRREGNG